jgi:hypothetical protein
MLHIANLLVYNNNKKYIKENICKGEKIGGGGPRLKGKKEEAKLNSAE